MIIVKEKADLTMKETKIDHSKQNGNTDSLKLNGSVKVENPKQNGFHNIGYIPEKDSVTKF